LKVFESCRYTWEFYCYILVEGFYLNRSAGNEVEGYFGVRFDMLLDEVRRDEYLDILGDRVLLGYILSLLLMLLLQNNNSLTWVLSQFPL
jgi:hypothetical protein